MGICRSGVLSERDFVMVGLCRGGILSWCDYVRVGECRSGIMSGKIVGWETVGVGNCRVVNRRSTALITTKDIFLYDHILFSLKGPSRIIGTHRYGM